MSPTEIPEVQRFLSYLRFEKRYSSHTVTAYQDDLADFFTFLEKDFAVGAVIEVTTVMIRSWTVDLTEKNMLPRSINRKISCLKSFFKYCRANELRDDNPASIVRLLKTRKRLPSYIEENQMETLFRDLEFPEDFKGQSEKLILVILYQTGIRVGELVAIRPGHIDHYQQSIKILGKGNKERLIPVNSDTLVQLKNYQSLKQQSGTEGSHLLMTGKNKPYTSRQVYEVVKKWLSLVTTAEKKSPHVLRHSFATHLMNNGANLNAVKDLLGHSSLAATQVYTHNSIEQLRDIHRKAHPKG